MKKVVAPIVILALCFMVFKTNSQEFNKYILFGTNTIITGSKSDKISNNDNRLGFFLDFRLDYVLNNTLSLVFGLNYYYANSSFKSPSYKFANEEIFEHLNNQIKYSIISLPILIKFGNNNSNKNFYFLLGLSPYYQFRSIRVIELEWYNYFLNPKEVHREKFYKDSFTFYNNQNSTFLTVGLGKNFYFKDNSMLLELKIENDLSTWKYPTIHDQYDHEFGIKKYIISFGFGYKFFK